MKPLKTLVLTAICALSFGGQQAKAELYTTIVQGLSGNTEYQKKFDKQTADLTQATHSIASPDNLSSFIGASATRADVLEHFSKLASNMGDSDRAAIYLIGHGSFDGEQYKFNIPGPDLSDADFKSILDNLPGQNHVLVNTSSASGAMFEYLKDSPHIMISATRNGNEKNAPQFPAFFAQGLSSESADTNKNNNISVQEAFSYAESEVVRFYESSGRLATEHPQIRGTGAQQFSLARITPVAPRSSNPDVTALLEERAAIDTRIEELQLRRAQYSNDDYIQRLQNLILEAANISEAVERLEAGDPSASD